MEEIRDKVILKPKEIQMSTLSVVGLKAELSRREAEYEQRKRSLGHQIPSLQLSKLKVFSAN
jgi:hypothetical protein